MPYWVNNMRKKIDRVKCFSTQRLFGRYKFTMSPVLVITALLGSPLSEAEEITLSSAIQRAVDKNPSLQVYRYRSLELEGLATMENLSPGLELSADIENFAGSGEFSGTDNAEMTLAISSVIELGGKRQQRGVVVSQRQKMMRADREVAALDLIGEVTRRYVETIASQQRLELAVRARELAITTLNSVEKRVEAGATSKVELLRAQAASYQAEMVVSIEQDQLAKKRLALSVLWGEDKPSFLKVSGNLFDLGVAGDFEALYSRAIKNPSIQLFANEERLRDAELRLAKAGSSSDINWSVGARHFKETDDTAVVASVSVPLFTSKRNAGSSQAALAAKNKVAIERDLALLKLRASLFSAFTNREQSLNYYSLLKERIIPSLQEALVETQSGYERGRFSYQEWLAARQELLESEYALITVAEQAQVHRAEIERLTAEPLSLGE